MNSVQSRWTDMSSKCSSAERSEHSPHKPSRHVLVLRIPLKLVFLQVNWHDFAFFDPVMYESLRQLIRHSQTGEADAVFAAMDLAFAIDLCKEEGAGQVRASMVTEGGRRVFREIPCHYICLVGLWQLTCATNRNKINTLIFINASASCCGIRSKINFFNILELRSY